MIVQIGDKRHDDYPHGCTIPIIQIDPQSIDTINCFICNNAHGKENYSNIEWNKGTLAQCNDCLSSWYSRKKRFQKYKDYHECLEYDLIDAVCKYDLIKVKELLSKGANPNHIRQDCISDNKNREGRYLWNKDGTAKPELSEIQPTTPLRCVRFRISDCLLGAKELKIFDQIVNELLKAGAICSDSTKQFIENRYSRSIGEDLELTDDSIERDEIFNQICRKIIMI